MSEKPLVVLAVEGDEELIECPACEGNEGYFDSEADKWVPCEECGGEGGYWRKRLPDSARI